MLSASLLCCLCRGLLLASLFRRLLLLRRLLGLGAGCFLQTPTLRLSLRRRSSSRSGRSRSRSLRLAPCLLLQPHPLRLRRGRSLGLLLAGRLLLHTPTLRLLRRRPLRLDSSRLGARGLPFRRLLLLHRLLGLGSGGLPLLLLRCRPRLWCCQRKLVWRRPLLCWCVCLVEHASRISSFKRHLLLAAARLDLALAVRWRGRGAGQRLDLAFARREHAGEHWTVLGGLVVFALVAPPRERLQARPLADASRGGGRLRFRWLRLAL